MRLGWAAVAAAVTATTLIGGCGGSTKLSGPPATVVTEALDGLGQLSAVRAVVRIEAPNLNDPSLSPAQVQAVLHTSLVVSVETPDGRSLASEGSSPAPSAQVDAAVVVGEDTVAEIRVLQHKMYARVDLAGLGAAFALSPSQRAEVSDLQSVLARDGQRVPALGALGAGRWVEVPTAMAVALGNEELVHLGIPLATTTLRPVTLGRVVSSLMGVVSGSTAADDGPVTGGESYAATLPTRDLLTSPLTTLAALAGTVGDSSYAEAVIGDAESIPGAATVAVNFLVSGRRLAEGTLPLGQLLPGNTSAENAEVVADFSPAPAITAPPSASPLDLAGLVPSLNMAAKV